MTTQEAIAIILSDKAAYSKSLNYAVGYCQAARSMFGHELAVQCLYILNNITHWRHPQAKEVRVQLKLAAKEA